MLLKMRGSFLKVPHEPYQFSRVKTQPHSALDDRSGPSWDQRFTWRTRLGDQVTIQADGKVNVYIADGIDYYAIIDGFLFDATNTWRAQVIIGSCCDPQPRSVRFQNNEFINNRFGAFQMEVTIFKLFDNKVHGGFEEFTGCGQVHCLGYAFYVGGSNNVFVGNEMYDVASWVFHIYNARPNTIIPHDNIFGTMLSTISAMNVHGQTEFCLLQVPTTLLMRMSCSMG